MSIDAADKVICQPSLNDSIAFKWLFASELERSDLFHPFVQFQKQVNAKKINNRLLQFAIVILIKIPSPTAAWGGGDMF